MKNFLIFNLLFLSALVIFRHSFSTFFAQDDFILINQFSSNSLAIDVENALGKPNVTHWRPVHNLYFLISGNLFGKNYHLYHLLTFGIHILAGYGVYKVAKYIFKKELPAIFAGFLYVANPLHFVSLFWISGSAGTIGFCFFIWFFYLYLTKKFNYSAIVLALSLLASEAMLVGTIIFLLYDFFLSGRKINLRYLISVGFIGIIFLVFKYYLFPVDVLTDQYRLQFSTGVLYAVKYYILRIAGFGEVSGDLISSLLTISFLTILGLFFFKAVFRKENYALFVFFTAIAALGLFPFILIPKHLSPHYMNISSFGFSMFAALVVSRQKNTVMIFLGTLFFLSAFLSVIKTSENNWVVKRSKISKYYIDKIEKFNPEEGSTLIFGDSGVFPSNEAYISLGTGKAIEFWIGDKFKTCFVAFEQCDYSSNYYIVQ